MGVGGSELDSIEFVAKGISSIASLEGAIEGDEASESRAEGLEGLRLVRELSGNEVAKKEPLSHPSYSVGVDSFVSSFSTFSLT